jgi:sugar phosphate isomerase/epimerase
MKRIVLIGIALIMAAGAALTFAQTPAAVRDDRVAPQIRHISPELQKKVEATNYKDVRIKKFPIAMQAWTFRRFTFFDTLAKMKELGLGYVQAYPGQALAADMPNLTFDHNMTDATMAKVKDKLKETGVSVVAYGVCDIGKTEAGMRKVFDFARKMGFRTVVCEPADDDFTLLEKLVIEYNVRIAIHNHPAPAKYNLPETVFAHMDGKDSRIGSCFDNGHFMRGMNDPREALKLFEGRIVDVHLKDRTDYGSGRGQDDTAWGQGKGNVRDLLAELTNQDYAGYLTMEYEKESEAADPVPAIKASVAYVKSITTYEGYDQIFKREKSGWNHYGPGYFEADTKTGVLKGQGGMGLLWYTKKYKDFILECDYKCATPETNSGIFLRVPDVPMSDDYIYHSFEIQIYDAGKDIHVTGAVYDVQAPKMNAFLPTGEWNHLKIEFRGTHLKIELNGKLVQDWEAKPGGKVKDFALAGFIGFQNHDSIAPPFFRNIYVK